MKNYDISHWGGDKNMKNYKSDERTVDAQMNITHFHRSPPHPDYNNLVPRHIHTHSLTLP